MCKKKHNRNCLDCHKKTTFKELNKYGGICEKCADAIEYHKPTHKTPEYKKKERCIGIVDETARKTYNFNNMKNSIDTLIPLIEDWAKEKGILEKATPLDQLSKTEEEVLELRESLFAQKNDMRFFYNSKGNLKNTQEEIEDAIGDVLVTLIIQAKIQNLNIVDCLKGAYDIISKREGEMVDGKFVKE
ncbi:MAG: MazG-like family protein [Flavobacteriaceae bacterium]